MSEHAHCLRRFITRCCLLCLVFTLPFAQPVMGQDTFTPQQQQQINGALAAMHRHLQQGDTLHAREALELTSGSVHSDEIELGLIQTLMHQGEYRHALSAAAHTQAEHPDLIDTTLYYAWLLNLGNNRQVAIDLVQAMQTQMTDNNADQLALQSMFAFLTSNQSEPDTLPPMKGVQYQPITDTLADAKKYTHIGGAALINHQYAVAAIPSLQVNQRYVVRNALGAIAEATVVRVLPEQHAALLRLTTPLPQQPNVHLLRNAAPLGKLVAVIGYPAIVPHPVNQWTPAWPQLRTDVISMPTKTNQRRWTLHTHFSSGAVVFSSHGEMLGIVCDDEEGQRNLLNVADLDLPNEVYSEAAKNFKPTYSELYEWGMLSALEIFEVK